MSVRHRPLGRTGLLVSELGLGTFGLSGDGYGPVDLGEAQRVLERALDLGITLIDTADAYGAGRMEALLGEVLAKRTSRQVVVVTKGGTDRSTSPARKRFDPAFLGESIRRSLKRLRRDALDVYLLHNPSKDAVLLGEATDALADAKKEGLLRHWGVAAGDVEVARAALEKGAEVVELAYNLLHAIDLHRLAGDVMVAGAGVLARSTLAHGMLTGLWGRGRAFEAGDHRAERWTKRELERRLEQLDAVRFLVKGDVLTLRAAATRYTLANHLVSSAVLGPRSVTQLDQLVRETGAGPTYLPDADLAALPRALQRAGVAT